MSEKLVTYRESLLTTDDGLALFAQCWEAAAPKAMIALVHGIAEHSSRYHHVGEYLASQGYSVYTFDLRGHGHSPGKRIFFRHMDEHRDDLRIFLEGIVQERPDLPLFLFGHSMGGLVVSYYLLTEKALPTILPIRGVILSAPAIQLEAISPWLMKAATLLAKVAPTVPMRQLEFAAISRDPLVLEANQRDALVYHGGIPVATGLAMARAVAYVQQEMANIQQPLLLLHGTADRMVTPEASQTLYERAASTDKTLKRYEGLYHELLNEPEKEEILAEISAWLAARL